MNLLAKGSQSFQLSLGPKRFVQVTAKPLEATTPVSFVEPSDLAEALDSIEPDEEENDDGEVEEPL